MSQDYIDTTAPYHSGSEDENNEGSGENGQNLDDTGEEEQTQTSQLTEFCSEMDIEEQRHRGEADVGIIEKVKLENFMNHSHLELNLGPHVNFIVGENGSGKSASLIAVTVCLGAGARFTHRGENLGDLVMRGKSYAIITVTLRNHGQDGFKPKEYGDKVIVERKIRTDGGSSYTLKNSAGKKVSSKKSEVKLMLEQFNIQIDNPCSILMQETSREFLNKSTPSIKYKFFLVATQLEQIKKDFAFIDSQVAVIRNTLERKRGLVPEMRKTVEQLKAEFDEVKSIQGTQEEVKKAKRKLAWSYVVQLENKLVHLEQELSKYRGMEQKLNEKMEKVGSEHQKVDEVLGETTKDIEEVSSKAATLTEEIKVLQAEKRSLGNTKAKIMNQLKDCEKRAKHLQNRRENVENALKDINERLESEIRQEKELKEAQLREKKNTLEEYSERLKQEHMNKNNKEEELLKWTEKLSQLETTIAQLDNRIKGYQRKMHEIDAAKKNRANVFGNETPKILSLIEANRNRFHFPPIGPLGLHLKVGDEKWTIAVEAAIGSGLLDCYIVSSFQDQKVLVELIRSKHIREPTILTATYDERVYQIPPEQRPPSAFTTALDVIQAEQPVVINALIDQQKIEKKILTETRQEAEKLMFSGNSDPRIVEVIDKAGNRYLNRGGTLDTRSFGKGISKLSTSTDGQIRGLKEELIRLEQNKIESNREYRAAQEQKKHLTLELNQIERARVAMERNIQKIKVEIEELQRKEKEKTVEDVKDLEQNIRNFNNEISACAQQMKELNLENQENEKKAEPIDNHIEAKETEIKDIQMKLKKFEESLKKIQTAKYHVVQAKKQGKIRIEKCQQIIEKTGKDIEKEKEDLEKTMESAVEMCERVDVAPEETPEALNRHIQQMEKQLEISMQGRRTLQEIHKYYKHAKSRYLETNLQIQNSMKLEQRVAKSLDTRRSTWHYFLGSVSRRTRNFFNGYLSQKGYSGDLIFDHKKQTLDVKVRLDANQEKELDSTTRGLSGGERSFSTVSLLLALWETMDIPFTAMDEFDVFMDAVNRRISIEMLVQTGERHRHRQFIFITPQDPATITTGPFVRIHKMSPPERSQSTLNLRKE